MESDLPGSAGETEPGQETLDPVSPATAATPEKWIDRLKRLVPARREPRDPAWRVHVIVNPAAGRDQPVLKILNAALQAADVDWSLFVTQGPGDARRLARRAARAGINRVIVYGGDGTVNEVASGLLRSEVPMAVLPGGTANVMVAELGLPTDLVEGCALAVDPSAPVLHMDAVQIRAAPHPQDAQAPARDRIFLLKAGLGFDAQIVAGADRQMKERLGVLAYAVAGLQALSDPPVANYHLALDGEEVDIQGLTCLLANAGTIAATAVSLAPDVSITDGLLDVFVLRRADLASLVSVAANLVGVVSGEPEALPHWRARSVTVTADPPQTIQADGELLGQSPLAAKVLPEAIRVVVPQPALPAGKPPSPA